MAVRTPSVHTVIRFEAAQSNGAPPPRPPRSPNPLPHLSFTKPSWVVRTESNVRKEKRKKPEPWCVVCKGSGRVDCHDCHGKGRTNLVHLVMLPNGEWPKWCRSCGGSGLGYCSRCLGTGEYRYIMGFQFMKMDNDTTEHKTEGYPERRSADDLLLNDEQLNLEQEDLRTL